MVLDLHVKDLQNCRYLGIRLFKDLKTKMNILKCIEIINRERIEFCDMFFRGSVNFWHFK